MKEMILIAVGGTGARVAQSVVALAAAGMAGLLNEEEEARLTIRLVDIDIHHKDGQELREMIETYNRTFGFLWDSKDGTKRKGWRPLEIVLEGQNLFYFQTGLNGGDVHMETIEDFVPGLDLQKGPRLLMDALYNEADREMSLYCGCKARPRVGSLLWEYLFQKYYTPFWSTLTVQAGSPEPARIMFVGSLFGGTGASGVPTLAKLLNQSLVNCQNYRMGLTLMAPYFYLNDSRDKKWGKGEIKVDFTQFEFQSKMALNYYMLSDILPDINCIQVVGNVDRRMIETDGKGLPHEVLNEGDNIKDPQDDPSVPTELTAAVGIMRFFTDQWETGVFVPIKDDKPDWGIFPEADKVRLSLQQLERFCAMTKYYFKTIALKADKGMAPTFVKELWSESVRNGSDWEAIWTSADNGLGNATDFSRNLLRWYFDLYNNSLRVLNIQKISSELREKARHGETSGINLMGVKGSKLIGCVNDRVACYMAERRHFQHKNQCAEAYTLALMDACETKTDRATRR